MLFQFCQIFTCPIRIGQIVGESMSNRSQQQKNLKTTQYPVHGGATGFDTGKEEKLSNGQAVSLAGCAWLFLIFSPFPVLNPLAPPCRRCFLFGFNGIYQIIVLFNFSRTVRRRWRLRSLGVHERRRKVRDLRGGGRPRHRHRRHQRGRPQEQERAVSKVLYRVQ